MAGWVFIGLTSQISVAPPAGLTVRKNSGPPDHKLASVICHIVAITVFEYLGAF